MNAQSAKRPHGAFFVWFTFFTSPPQSQSVEQILQAIQILKYSFRTNRPGWCACLTSLCNATDKMHVIFSCIAPPQSWVNVRPHQSNMHDIVIFDGYMKKSNASKMVAEPSVTCQKFKQCRTKSFARINWELETRLVCIHDFFNFHRPLQCQADLPMGQICNIAHFVKHFQ